ncbi:uncharacterized protein [Hemitrygon akajei]|uniref:uncharacterized protein isoform X2 n=1 Tax=Hemitrygon akajei TaxID=2704970 RepID=UPI003BF9BE18
MDNNSDGPVFPETGDGQSNQKGKKKIGRNTDHYVPCDTPMGQGNAPRYIKLSEYKKLDKNFQPNRPAIWPVKPATMKAKPTARTQQLAKLKPSYNDMKREESEDKAKTMNSVNFKGKKSGSKKEPVIYADVPRFVYLSEPKKLAAHFVGNRPSPVWPLRSATLNAIPSSRISELAKSKQLHKDWQADRTPYTMVSQDIQYIENLPRMDFLAQHKKRAEPPTKSSHLWDYPYWDNEISEATKSYSPSERIQELASKNISNLSIGAIAEFFILRAQWGQ